MARIGVLPSKTSVELRQPDGAIDTLPAASSASAGVMTAQHVKMLEEVFTWFQTRAGDSAPVIIERSADMSQYPTKLELKAMLQAMPRALDMGPDVSRLRGELMALQSEIIEAAKRALPAPSASTDVVDQTARTVMYETITLYESMDQRLRAVESVIDTLRSVAELKGAA